jgi:hypothetical protein
MAKKSITVKLEDDYVELLNDAAEKLDVTKTDIISRGIPLAIIWQRTKNSMPLHKKLIYDDVKEIYEAEESYRKTFVKSFVRLLEKSIAIP